MDRMSHYVAERWVDFVRNLLPEAERAQMQAHLDGGCERCRRELDLLRQVVSFTAVENSYRAPEDVARLARAIYRPMSEPAGVLRRLLGALIYDGFGEPVMAGVRHAAPSGQQLAFNAGDYCVDLRVQGQMDSSQVAMAGQIVNRKAPEDRLAGLPVALVSGRRIIAETLSNEFGEFSLEYTTARKLRLQIEVSNEGVRIDLPLRSLAGGTKDSEI